VECNGAVCTCALARARARALSLSNATQSGFAFLPTREKIAPVPLPRCIAYTFKERAIPNSALSRLLSAIFAIRNNSGGRKCAPSSSLRAHEILIKILLLPRARSDSFDNAITRVIISAVQLADTRARARSSAAGDSRGEISNHARDRALERKSRKACDLSFFPPPPPLPTRYDRARVAAAFTASRFLSLHFFSPPPPLAGLARERVYARHVFTSC